LEILRELVKSMLSMVTPRLAGIGRPSFCQVMVMGKSPETTTHGMKTRCPMENLGNSKGWIKGGTERERERKCNRGCIVYVLQLCHIALRVRQTATGKHINT
jgi:hypothetical protein